MYSICWGSCWYYLTVLQSSIKHLDFFHWSFSPPWAAASWDTVCEVSYLGLSFLFFCCLAVCPATPTPLEGAAHPRLCHFSGCAEEGPPSPGWLYNWQPNRRVITVVSRIPVYYYCRFSFSFSFSFYICQEILHCNT